MTDAATRVAVGVIWANGKILITQRAKHAHQGGFWEFPGGKLEPGETVQSALRRELQEEVGILVQDSTPLIKIDYRYPDKRVILDVWHIHAFSGTAAPHEGQPLRWVAPPQLLDFNFPAANQAIIKAVLLPDRYAILEGSNSFQIERHLQQIITNKASMLQLRVKNLPGNELAGIYALVAKHCRNFGIRLLLNSDLPLANAKADGLHLSSRCLLASSSRPVDYQWVGASCHNLTELQHAERIGVDFALLAPVLPTTTHPNAEPIGWQGFREQVEQVNIPVYALGGLGLKHLQQALNAGAQGIAGISAFL